MRHIHYAPYLDCCPLSDDEPDVDAILARPEAAWIDRQLEQNALAHEVAHVVPEHLAEVRSARLALIAKTEAAVKDRVTKEITYWDHRAEQLKDQERPGRPNAKLNSGEARKRADLLQGRLQKRLEELKLESHISPTPPVVLGGVMIVRPGFARRHDGPDGCDCHPADRHPGQRGPSTGDHHGHRRSLGYEPTDREMQKLGYDIESRVPGTGKLRFIEVKGRVAEVATITVTKNEILYSLNKPDDFILAIVELLDAERHRVHYVRRPFQREPDFGVTSVNYNFAELLQRAEAPP
jgi:hypothetical protein